MKDTKTIAMKRSFRTILFPIVVASAGCTTTDNNVGRLGQDARVADGLGQDASGAPAQPADAKPVYSPSADAAAPEVAGVSKDVAHGSLSADAAASEVAGVSKDVAYGSPSADAAAPDAASVGTDVAQGAPDAAAPQCPSDAGVCDAPPELPADICTNVNMVWRADDGSELRREGYRFIDDLCAGYRCLVGNEIIPSCYSAAECPAACSGACVLVPTMRTQCLNAEPHQCQLNAYGGCSAVTLDTSCTPFIGYRYEESAGCYSRNATTLGCCATGTGESCGLPAAIGCYQIATASETLAYWTPALTTPAVIFPGGQPCEQSQYPKFSSASPCAALLPDAGAPRDGAVPDAGPDGHVPVMLPLCATDSDCCVSVDDCMATATLSGNGSYGPVPGTHAIPGTCLSCIVPAIQVQCQGGFCVGTRLSVYDSSSPLLRSHCGTIALSDAGAAHAESPHAVVDGGPSYQTFWSCGGP